MEQDPNLIYVGVVVLILLSMIIVYSFMKESFNPEEVPEKKDFIKNVTYTSENPSILSTGDIQKYKNGDIFIYNMFFNLPSIGSPFQTTDLDKPFNSEREKSEYQVYASENENDFEKIGVLTRTKDGNHVLHIHDKKEYSLFKVILENSIVAEVKI